MAAVAPVEKQPIRPYLGGDLRCAECGYGIVPRLGLPERCPMCSAQAWTELATPRPPSWRAA